MSIEKTKDLLRALARDEDFRRDVEAADTTEERFKVFAKHGFAEVTEADIRATKAELDTQDAQGELTDQELEVVAGGRDGTTTWLGILVTVLELL